MKKSNLVLFCILLLIGNLVFAQQSVPEKKTKKSKKGKIEKPQPEIFTTINGKITNDSHVKITLEDIKGETELGSSAIDKDGQFKISVQIKENDFYRLKLSTDSTIFLILKPGENVNIEVQSDKLAEPKITGSEESMMLYTTGRKLSDYQRRIDSITNAVNLEKREYVQNYIKQNSNSLATLLVLRDLDMEKDEDLYKDLIRNLKKVHPNNLIVADLYNQVFGSDDNELGNSAPEISLPDSTGKNIMLSSLKGKIVLVDFWASWCRPCRMEAPNVVALYQKYKSKGFEIYGVSLDEDGDAWKQAIISDKLSWIHVSDLKGWGSQAGQTYNVKGIPFTVLLDKEGRIIAKGLRGGELQKKLSELLD